MLKASVKALTLDSFFVLRLFKRATHSSTATFDQLVWLKKNQFDSFCWLGSIQIILQLGILSYKISFKWFAPCYLNY